MHLSFLFFIASSTLFLCCLCESNNVDRIKETRIKRSPDDEQPQLTFNSAASQDFPSGNIVKRMPSMGFVGMRGKKPWLDRNSLIDERTPKRAPSGFLGMRGKKSNLLDMDDDLMMDKRMVQGFYGVRGKKGDGNFEKRGPPSSSSFGFVGMRGRRNFQDELIEDFEKRAPSGFLGMRGKKQWTLFGLRGKKIPYQFRGKFVGVRGKKSENQGRPETDSEQLLMMQLMAPMENDKTDPAENVNV